MTNFEVLTLCSTRHALRTGEFALTIIEHLTVRKDNMSLILLETIINDIRNQAENGGFGEECYEDKWAKLLIQLTIVRNKKKAQKEEIKKSYKIVAAYIKKDKEAGFILVCSNCKRYVSKSGKCECGCYVDLELPSKPYYGRVRWI